MEINTYLEHYKACFDSAPMATAIIRIDKNAKGQYIDYHYVYCNLAIAKLLGTTKEFLYQNTYCSMFDENKERKWLNFLGAMSESETTGVNTGYNENMHRAFTMQAYRLIPGYCACFLNDVTEDYIKGEQNKKILLQKYRKEMFYQQKSNDDKMLVKMQINLTKDNIENYIIREDVRDYHLQNTSYAEKMSGQINDAVYLDIERMQRLLDRQTLLQKFYSGQVTENIEYQRRMKNGNVIWAKLVVKLFANPMTGDIICFQYAYDINQMKMMQMACQSLVNHNFDFAGIANTLTGSFFCISNIEKRFQANVQYEDYDTTTKQFVDAMQTHFLTQEDYRKAKEDVSFQNVMEQLEKKDIYSFLLRYVDDVHQTHTYQLTFNYVDRDRTQILICRSDITKAVSEEMRQKEILTETLIKVERANLAKTEFLSRMSHDMRTPLSSMIGIADLILEEPGITTSIRNYMKDMKSSGEYLLSIMNDLLDLGQIESEKMCLQMQHNNLQEILHLVKCNIEQLAIRKEIQFDVHARGDMIRNLRMDSVRVQQILMNLLSNAVKFTPKAGKVSLTVTQLNEENGMANYQFEICDNGIGMHREFLPMMYQPYEQEKRNGGTECEGSGLGLTIAQKLVNLMKGVIKVESVPGKGTKFILVLPFAIDENQERIYEEEEDIVDLQGLRFLICEDYVLLSKLTCKLLENHGGFGEVVNDGETCIARLLEKSPGYFDAILMDIHMPVMNGLDTTRFIRKMERKDLKEIPVYAMTANVFEDDRRKCIRAGMNAHLEKPISMKQLQKLLVEEGLITKKEKSL